ncbi:MAG: signal peptidase I [Candidatus Omnitrophota bacterium]
MANKEIDKFLEEIHINFLKEGKAIWAQTQGKSMEPLIKEGDFVKIVPIKTEEIKRGDIVAFLSNGKEKIIIAHRLIKKKNNKLVTCGDSFILANDPPLEEERILGKVVAVRRNKREIKLEKGIWYFYGKFISYLRIYGFPLLALILSLYKIFTQPKIFLRGIVKRVKIIIREKR